MQAFYYPDLPDRHFILKEGVMHPLVAQRRHRAVSGINVTSSPSGNNFCLIDWISCPWSPREIAASYATFEDHIAGNQQTGLVIKEDNMAAYARDNATPVKSHSLRSHALLRLTSDRASMADTHRGQTCGFGLANPAARTHLLSGPITGTP